MATATSSGAKVSSESSSAAMPSRSGGANRRMRIPVSLPGDLADAADELRVGQAGGAGRPRHPRVGADVAVRVDVDDVRGAVLGHAEVDAAVVAQLQGPEDGHPPALHPGPPAP